MNKAIVLGHLGQDPETKYLPSGNAVTNISVATSEQWKDKQSGQKQERTEWHRCSAFGKLAEIIGQYARKGGKVYIEGSLRTRKWQAQDGSDRYSTEIVISEFQMLDGKPEGSRNTTNENQGSQQTNSNPQSGGGGFADFDDVPFGPVGKEWMA